MIESGRPVKDIEILEYISKNNYLLFIYLVFREMIFNLNNNNPQVVENLQFITINREISNYFNFEELFNGGQNDPHELIVYLLDKVHDSKKSKININTNKDVINCIKVDLSNSLYLTNPSFKKTHDDYKKYHYVKMNNIYYIN